MKVILLQDVKSVGKKGDIVEANDGYARNFLLPKKFAKEYIPATPGSKPPHTMKEYEKWDTYCFGGYDPQLTEKQEARNYNDAHWQQILAQEAIDKQLKQEAI